MTLRHRSASRQAAWQGAVRGRRTMISMVVIPLIAIPLMFRMMTFFTRSNQKEAAEQAMVVAVSNESNVQDILPALAKGGFKTVVKSDLRDAVQKKEAAAGIDE